MKDIKLSFIKVMSIFYLAGIRKSKLLICFLLLASAPDVTAQSPLRLLTTATLSENKIYEVRITGVLDPGWHIYSQQKSGGGPMATTIEFDKNSGIELLGVTKDTGTVQYRYDDMSGENLACYTDTIVLLQHIKVIDKRIKKLTGNITFMACNENFCIPAQAIGFEVLLPRRKK